MPTKIKVLIVEDSAVARMLLTEILQSDPRIEVLAAVPDGPSALEFLQKERPDVVLMDIHMPGMNGYEATRLIMESHPVPIVVCSATYDANDVANTFRALDAGAVAAVAKPPGPGHPDYSTGAAKLLEAVTLMSEVRVVKRWPRHRRPGSATPPPSTSPVVAAPAFRVIAIGASTGGPPALQTILAALPRTLPVPVLIVQHIAAGFLPGLVEWLAESTGFPVRIARHDEPLLRGHAYLAPDDYHMGINAAQQIVLSKHEPESGLRPAVSYLFRSVAAACGSHAVAVLLTGMGKDGARELKELKELGATTFAQDAETSVVHGMPGEAIRLEAADYVLSPERIAAALAGCAPAGSQPPGPRSGEQP